MNIFNLSSLLPAANEVWDKVMFYMCPSFCSQADGFCIQGSLPPGAGQGLPFRGSAYRARGLNRPPSSMEPEQQDGMHPTEMLSCIS